MATVSFKMDDAFHQMRGSLSKYARSNDRRMVLRSMRDVKYLACLPLDPLQPDDASLFSLESELSKESIVLNGIAFHSNKDFLKVMHELCLKLCDNEAVTVNPQYLYEQLVIRMARSTAAADSHFKLNSVMGSPDVMIMPVPTKKITQLPITLTLFVSKSCVHAQISTANTYGIFRKTDVKASSSSSSLTQVPTTRPWISFQAIVDERVNISNGDSVRLLRVKLPELY